MNWWPNLNKEVKFCEPLSKHTTFKVGGVADIWFEPRSLSNLRKILNSCRKKSIPFLVIGNGSNLLVKQRGVRGVVIHLNSPYFKRISSSPTIRRGEASCDHHNLSVGCGVSLNRLADFAKQKGWGGCEFLAGIPGTVGGALITNAGVRDVFSAAKKKFCSIGDIIEEITIMDAQGALRTLKIKEIRFRYRYSILSKFVILKAKIKLNKKRVNEIESAMDKFMKYKKATQELTRPSAGSVFKNPSRISAARLIESSGLKGLKIGDAQLSAKHSNFIVNLGKAESRDILALIRLVQDRVKARYGIKLTPEIQIVEET